VIISSIASVGEETGRQGDYAIDVGFEG